jgi:hypothetical protein
MAERVETAIREKIVFLAQMPGAGHQRKNLTDHDVRFFLSVFVLDRIPALYQAFASRFHSPWAS